jgi:hypothetical protein
MVGTILGSRCLRYFYGVGGRFHLGQNRNMPLHLSKFSFDLFILHYDAYMGIGGTTGYGDILGNCTKEFKDVIMASLASGSYSFPGSNIRFIMS